MWLFLCCCKSWGSLPPVEYCFRCPVSGPTERPPKNTPRTPAINYVPWPDFFLNSSKLLVEDSRHTSILYLNLSSFMHMFVVIGWTCLSLILRRHLSVSRSFLQDVLLISSHCNRNISASRKWVLYLWKAISYPISIDFDIVIHYIQCDGICLYVNTVMNS